MTGFLTLWMGGTELPLDEITDTLKINPTFSCKKDDTKIDVLGQTVTYIENC